MDEFRMSDLDIKLAIYRSMLQHGGSIKPNSPDQGLIEICEAVFQWVKK